jgi:hypothetical protein
MVRSTLDTVRGPLVLNPLARSGRSAPRCSWHPSHREQRVLELIDMYKPSAIEIMFWLMPMTGVALAALLALLVGG